MGQPVVHWELWSQHPAAVAKFYQDIFAWKIEDYPQMNYRIVHTEGGGTGIDGGIMQSPHEGPGGLSLTCYIAVDDLAAYREKIVAAGGKICVEEKQVPGMGSLALFTDPDGRTMGLWKPEKPA